MNEIIRYVNNVFRLQTAIYDIMEKNGVTAIKGSSEIIPTKHQFIEKEGIYIEFYYGFPRKIYTLYGEILIVQNGIIGRNKEKILNKIISEYGAIKIEDRDCNTEIYSLTELPWNTDYQI